MINVLIITNKYGIILLYSKEMIKISVIDNKLINSIIKLGIAESNTQLTNMDKKIRLNNILNFMPPETATILRENEDFLKENGIDITNPKDMIMCTIKIMFSELDLLSNQISGIQDSLLGDRIAEIQSAKDFYDKYENSHKRNNKIISEFKELVLSEKEIIQSIKDKKFSNIERKYNENLKDERDYLLTVLKDTTSGINRLQNSFSNDIKVILDMPTEKVAIKSMFPFLCKFTGEKVSKVEVIDASNHRCKQTLAYIEQGYKLQILVTINLYGDDAREDIENIIKKYNTFLEKEVMCGNNIKKIHEYDDDTKEFWLTEPKRMLEDINSFTESLNISEEISMAIDENQEEFYEDEDYENVIII